MVGMEDQLEVAVPHERGGTCEGLLLLRGTGHCGRRGGYWGGAN